MHTDGKSRLATGIVVLTLLTAFSHPLWSQAADESGTLVMVARTASAIIVSVDSKITPLDSTAKSLEPRVTPVDGDRKLVDVGEHSSCALDGFLGANEAGHDVSALMRSWVAAHPKAEAQEAINALLDAAAGPWDLRHYTLAEIAVQIKHRKVGDPITTITCGEFVDGKPIIVVGETRVKANGLWDQVAEKTSPQEEKTVLYMGGIYDVESFFHLIDERSFRPESDPKFNDGDRDVREDVRANTTATAALVKWFTAPSAPSAWTQTDVKDLFVPTFASVEKHFSDWVGTPNNIRILTACGRLEATVEGDWPTCPASSSPATKK
jgi:hypothetical protein